MARRQPIPAVLILGLLASGCGMAEVVFPGDGKASGISLAGDAAGGAESSIATVQTQSIIGVSERSGLGARLIAPINPGVEARLLLGATEGDGLVAAGPLPSGDQPQLVDALAMGVWGEAWSGLGCSAASFRSALDHGLMAIGACSGGGEAAPGAVHILPIEHFANSGWRELDGATRILGDAPGGAFGSSIATGDLDGDGVQELLIGAPDALDGAGQVFLIPTDGALDVRDAEGMMLGPADGEASGLGSKLVIPGDLTGDGHDDAISCAPGATVGPSADAGECTIHAGGLALLRAGGDLAASRFSQIRGSDAGDRLGEGAASIVAGDFDGNGRLDLAIGAPGRSLRSEGEGTVAIWFDDELEGNHSLRDAGMLAAGSGRAGSALAAVPDADGDNADELLIGAPSFGGGAGAVSLVTGLAPGMILLPEDARMTWTGRTGGQGLGAALAFSPRLGGDGLGRVLVGAPGDDAGGEDAGRVWIFSLYQ